MAVSFDCVDDKVKEADFFLEKLRVAGVNFNYFCVESILI